MVEDVEGFGADLEAKSVGDPKISEQGSIEIPVAGTHKGIPAQVSHAAWTRSRKEILGQVEPVGPLGVGGMNIVGDRVGAVIRFAIQVVVAAFVYATGRF